MSHDDRKSWKRSHELEEIASWHPPGVSPPSQPATFSSRQGQALGAGRQIWEFMAQVWSRWHWNSRWSSRSSSYSLLDYLWLCQQYFGVAKLQADILDTEKSILADLNISGIFSGRVNWLKLKRVRNCSFFSWWSAKYSLAALWMRYNVLLFALG